MAARFYTKLLLLLLLLLATGCASTKMRTAGKRLKAVTFGATAAVGGAIVDAAFDPCTYLGGDDDDLSQSHTDFAEGEKAMIKHRRELNKKVTPQSAINPAALD